MRWSVVLADLTIFYPICLLMLRRKLRTFSFDYQWAAILMVLCAPPLILIDHGHFQYNCVALGLTLWGAHLCM
jgi:alpha-1,3-glucosyltransferase